MWLFDTCDFVHGGSCSCLLHDSLSVSLPVMRDWWAVPSHPLLCKVFILFVLLAALVSSYSDCAVHLLALWVHLIFCSGIIPFLWHGYFLYLQASIDSPGVSVSLHLWLHICCVYSAWVPHSLLDQVHGKGHVIFLYAYCSQIAYFLSTCVHMSTWFVILPPRL